MGLGGSSGGVAGPRPAKGKGGADGGGPEEEQGSQLKDDAAEIGVLGRCGGMAAQ